MPKEVDPEQGLSDEGWAETKKIALAAREHGLKIARIMHSGRKRAAQTAEIFAASLRPHGGLTQGDGLNPLDDVATFSVKIDESEDLMLVGHLPFLERLASFLIIGIPEKSVIRFQNSGIVCLGKDTAADHWTIRWSLFPGFR